jgi:hypothetical protein
VEDQIRREREERAAREEAASAPLRMNAAHEPTASRVPE